MLVFFDNNYTLEVKMNIIKPNYFILMKDIY